MIIVLDAGVTIRRSGYPHYVPAGRHEVGSLVTELEAKDLICKRIAREVAVTAAPEVKQQAQEVTDMACGTKKPGRGRPRKGSK